MFTVIRERKPKAEWQFNKNAIPIGRSVCCLLEYSHQFFYILCIELC